MTKEEFKKMLPTIACNYKEEGDKIIVYSNHGGTIDMVFRFTGDFEFEYITSIPPNVEFRNPGDVNLSNLEILPEGTKFRNGGDVILESLVNLNFYPGMEFENMGDIYLKSAIGGWLKNWEGSIKGIDSKRILNEMIEESLLVRK